MHELVENDAGYIVSHLNIYATAEKTIGLAIQPDLKNVWARRPEKRFFSGMTYQLQCPPF
jgi:hypothetical protein